MELRQLEYLVAVVDHRSFTKAAEQLHVAQPGVSAQIRRLERELGQPLLDRSNRSVRPTRAGEAILVHARAALTATTHVRSAMEDLSGLTSGAVAIGTVRSHEVEFADLLGGFHRAHPGIAITLTEVADSERLAEAVRAGELDLALVALGTTAPEGLAVHVVLSASIVAAVPEEHPWSARSSVPLRSLAGPPLICLPRGTGVRSRLDRAFAARDLVPNVALEASSPTMLAQLAAAGLGVAVVPSVVVDDRTDRLRAIPITRPALDGRLAFVWRDEPRGNPAAEALVERVRRQFPTS